MVLGQLDFYVQKNFIEHLLYFIYKNWLKMDQQYKC